MNRYQISLTLLAATALLAGCTVGPEPARPGSVADGAEAFVGPRSAAAETQDVTHWWRTFDDEVTDDLVAQALEHNADLRAAAARVAEARALLGVARGQRLPQVSFNSRAQRDRNNFTLPMTGRVQTLSTTYDVVGGVTWQADLFGKLKRQEQGATFELLATEADRQALQHTIVAETVRARVQVATLTRLLEVAKANTVSFEKTMGVIERRYERGVASAVELRLARENLSASRAREPDVEYQLRAAQLALDVLVGKRPGTGEDAGDTLTQLPPVAQPPTGLPVALLDRRPDLMGAQFRNYAETAGVGVAMADLYPDVSISASGGWRADRTRDLFDGDTLVWSLVGELAWKVWAGGSLRSQVDAAQARVERTAAEYAQAVLVAMQEVEDALVREETARRAHGLRTTQVDEARKAEQLARERYERGVESILTVLETEQRRRNAENALVIEQQTLWNARINLFLALGGDWGLTDETLAANENDPIAIGSEE